MGAAAESLLHEVFITPVFILALGQGDVFLVIPALRTTFLSGYFRHQFVEL